MSEPLSPATIPEKPTLAGLEAKWGARWETDATYSFDRTATRDQVFAIDTPPPTVSGSLHVGHIFSYTHTDTVARFWRMRGKAVFYPMGWDDNGLPTERRVQNFYGVTCDPSLPYDADFTPPFAGDVPKNLRDRTPISRPNFVDLCRQLVQEDEKAFENLFRTLGLSIDWDYLYTTIDDARKTSQRAFLRNVRRAEAYSQEAPTLWDVDFQTAVAQAELADRDTPAAYHQIRFHQLDADGQVVGDLTIDTTRPELLPSCVAMVAHPDDVRYQPLFGSRVRTPLFEVAVPVVAHRLADPEKGTGIAMICTFGDLTDVTWWRELHLPTRGLVGRDGRMLPDGTAAAWVTTAGGRAAYAKMAGKTVKQAHAQVVELLRGAGKLVGEPRPITHPVKYFDKGDRPLEIVTTRQWYIRNGGRDEPLRQDMLARGRELAWHPEFMRHRYTNWVEGLNGDWLISRQRYFGVPIPLWYSLGADATPDWDHPLLPDDSALPIDPSTDVPPGYLSAQRGQAGGFVGDRDVMDTWATSSLSPQIAGRWGEDDDLFERVFPMDMRPQSHEIIRTWLFATVVRAHLEHGALPWAHASISGWILDPDRKKMGKSVGNVITPIEYFDQYGADAVRYWASSARPGMDTAFDEAQMKIGRKLAIKLLNASKFVLGIMDGAEYHQPASVTMAVDRAMLARVGELCREATLAFEAYDYARALERTEQAFWYFCDDYLELVKGRAYGSLGPEAAASARATLALCLSAFQRMFAPFLPYATEEVWSWWQAGSIHRASWPTAGEFESAAEADPAVLEMASLVLSDVRRAKTEAKRSMRWKVDRVDVLDTSERLAALGRVEDDLREAGSVGAFVYTALTENGSAGPEISVTLAAEDA